MGEPLTSLALVGNVGTLRLEAGDAKGHHALCCWNALVGAYEWLVCWTGKTGLPFVALGYRPTLWEAVQAAAKRLKQYDDCALFHKPGEREGDERE